MVMKAKKFSRRLMLASISSVAGMSLVGSIFGTVAWYQYSTRATASIMGSDASVSENLQITLGDGNDGANWKTDLTRNDIYNYVKNTTDNPENALSVKAVTNVGTTEKNYVLGNEDALGTFYSHPVYQYADYSSWNTVTEAAGNYVTFPLSFKVVANANAVIPTEGLSLYLNDLRIVQSGDTGKDISDAVRVHFSSTTNNLLLSKEGGAIDTHGPLDLNGDGHNDKEMNKYDFDTDAKELVYGASNSTQTSFKLDDVKPTDDKGKLTGDKELGKITKDGILTVTVTMWLEGWQKLGETGKASSIWNTDFIGSNFNVGMTFAVTTLD